MLGRGRRCLRAGRGACLLAGETRLDAHDLLRCRFQVSGRLCLPAQALDAVENLSLLRSEGVADLLHPVEIGVELGQHLRERYQ